MTGGGYLRVQMAAPFREVRHVLVCVCVCVCSFFFPRSINYIVLCQISVVQTPTSLPNLI